MNISFEFKTMYEPGENAPPQFELEYEIKLNVESVPRFKDQINFKGKKYFVYDVIYDYPPTPLDAYANIYITAVRKVTYPLKEIFKQKGEQNETRK